MWDFKKNQEKTNSQIVVKNSPKNMVFSPNGEILALIYG
jgi:hypothetical protein